MRFRTELYVLLLFGCIGGCALFRGDTADHLRQKLKEQRLELDAKPSEGVPVKRIVRLTASVIDQPVSENRVRQAVWRQMCESVLQKWQARRVLNESGFRVGVSQPPYPWALQSLLSTSQNQIQQENSRRRSGSGHMYFSASGQSGLPIVIPDGSESLVEIRRGTRAEIPNDVVIPGMTGVDAGDEIRCVLRIKTIETGDDWMLLQFVPELQFGRATMRLTVKDAGDHLPIRQKIVPLFDQQFEIKLRKDDVVVVGHSVQDQWTIGQFFFQTDSVTSATEHLLTLQVSQIESITGRPSVQVNYRKY
ncbi:MAG: hypothetical protein MK110_03985 [Fuerstiella sp.]|nr:hypothetical protein [Fuerstiella sp.]